MGSRCSNWFVPSKFAGGMIGSLSHLIRGGAIEAILTGTEKLTRTLLETVELDHAADSRRPHVTATPRP